MALGTATESRETVFPIISMLLMLASRLSMVKEDAAKPDLNSEG